MDITPRSLSSQAGPRLVALIAALVLTTAPVTAAMQRLPGDDAVGVAAGDQQDPELAQGGDLVLVVWADERSTPTGYEFYEYETASDIYGQRLDANGNPMDPVPLVITQAKAAQDNPQVAWNGTHWLVVFETVSDTELFYAQSLAAVRVAPNGEVVDTDPIPTFGVEPVGDSSWSLATDGDHWVIGFQASDSSSQIEALRITADGVVEQPPTVLVPGTYFLRFDLKLAYAAGVYLFTWSEFSDTFAMRFDADFAPLDPEPYLLQETTLADLEGNGSQFYVVWTQQRPNFSVGVFGSRIGTDGVKLDGIGVDISGDQTPQPYTTTGVAWDGTLWKATWTTGGVLRVARIDAGGQVLDFEGIPVPGPESGPIAPAGSGGLYVVWSDYVGGEYDVFGAHIPAQGPASPNVTLSTGGPQQARSDVAVGSGGYMVVFRSDVDNATRVKAMPLDSAGLPVLAEPLELDSGTRLSGPGTPAVAWNGSLYLATWGGADGIVAQRLLQDGTHVDTEPFPVMPGFGATDVAALGSDFLVIGRQFGYSNEVISPVVSRVRANGTVLDPEGIVIGVSYVRSVAVTTLGDRWLAVWHRTFTHDDTLGENMAAFVDTSGTSSGDFQVFGVYSMGGGNFIFSISAAAGDDSALIAQSAELTSGVETDLAAVLVHLDGTVDPYINLTPWEGNQYRPKVAWDGRQFVVVYDEQKNRFANHTLDQLDARSDLFGMRIRPDGTIVDPQGFAFSLSETAEAYPSIAADGGVSLVAGSILRNEAPFGAYRIGYERFGVGGNQWPVAVASSSTSGGEIPVSAQFDSLGSRDPDGAIVSFFWDFGDGATSTLPAPAHTYTVAGEYVPTLTVFDDGGARTTDTVRIEAKIPNIPPVAIAIADVTSGPPPLAVVFDGAGSYDVDGTLGNFLWEFGDGGTYWGSTAYHTFTQPGDYLVTLTIWDDDGATGTDTLAIEVREPCVENCLRVAGIRLKPAERAGNLGVRGGARIVDENGAFLEGATVDVHWIRPNGSALDQSRTTATNGIARFGTPGGKGHYTFTVADVSKPGYTFDTENSVLSDSIDR